MLKYPRMFLLEGSKNFGGKYRGVCRDLWGGSSIVRLFLDIPCSVIYLKISEEKMSLVKFSDEKMSKHKNVYGKSVQEKNSRYACRDSKTDQLNVLFLAKFPVRAIQSKS